MSMPVFDYQTLGQYAFEQCDFGDLEIVDKLRDIQPNGLEDSNYRFMGTCFGRWPDAEESVKISFHFQTSLGGNLVLAYAYECNKGQEIAFIDFDQKSTLAS